MKEKWAGIILTTVLGSSTLNAVQAETYDYIIVGAGAAGCVLAARLTENPQISVLVLEAGGADDDERIHQPASFRQLLKSPYDWNYRTQKEPQLKNREISWPRGKGWGGSGSISAMVYVRGHRRDFDRWAELGNQGWSYEDVLPYFKKAENQERGPSHYHGVGGPHNVADPRWVPPISRAFIEAALHIGLTRNEDFNGLKQEGSGYYQLNQKNGERHSAAAAYLRPALHRQNLYVKNNARATQVLFENRRAIGVTFQKDKKTHVVRAKREILVAAGTIGSPQLLLLSGIGPAQQLKELKIGVVQDLPGVGANLQDHPRVPLTYRSKQPLGFDRAAARSEYHLQRTGPLSSNGVGAGAFVRTSAEKLEPDVQIFLTADPSQSVFALNVTLMRPHSRGHIRLASKDAEDYPLIYANYLADVRDLEGLAAGLEIARRVAEAQPLDGYRGEELGPGSRRRGGDQLRGYIRENVATFFHPVGTCKMGTDPLSVVDDQLRVRGVDGLRVIDASVMPTLVAGATHAATVMIAEKGADLLKAEWTE